MSERAKTFRLLLANDANGILYFYTRTQLLTDSSARRNPRAVLREKQNSDRYFTFSLIDYKIFHLFRIHVFKTLSIFCNVDGIPPSIATV